MKSFNPSQKLLLPPEDIFDIHPQKKYQILFSCLDSTPLKIINPHGPERPPISKQTLLKSLIYKNLKTLPTLYGLAVDLIDNPHLALQCGLIAGANPHTVKQRLSSFLRTIPNQLIQKIKSNLISKLISLREINGRFLSIDSCHILANVKENNLKTSVKDQFNKSKIPKGDLEARLGVLIHFKKNSEKMIE